MAFSYAADISITVVRLSHCSWPMRSKKVRGSRRSSPWPPRRPRSSTTVRAMTLAVGEFIHADTREALPPIWVETRLPNTTNDPADGAPGHAENIRHRRDVRQAASSSMRWVNFVPAAAHGTSSLRGLPSHRPQVTRAAIHQPDPDRSPVEILHLPTAWGGHLGRASATFSTPWFSPRRRDRDQDFIGTIHGDPTDVQLRDTEELFEYRCEAHGDLRLTVESRNPTLQHVPVRALSINPTRSTT